MFYKKMLTAVTAILFGSLLFAQSPKLTDADIAHIGVTANQIDINYAEVARKNSTNTEVVKFANLMSTDHKAVIDQAVALVTKLGVTPTDNEISKSLMKSADAKIKEMSKLKGDAFNKAYLENEVAYHQAVISTVKETLIPTAQNRELKDFLGALVAPLESHLEHAQMALAQIK